MPGTNPDIAPALSAEPGPGWETLFWDVFERTLDPIVLVDESRRAVAANSAAVDLLGYCRGDLVGRPTDELITSPTQAQRDRDWQRVLQVGEVSSTYAVRRGDGSQIEIDFATKRVCVGQRTLGVVVVWPLGRVTLARQVWDQATPLTVREREVVALIALGHDTNRAAEELFISPETVRTHVRNAMAKLGVHTRAQLVAVAFSRGELLQAGSVTDFTGLIATGELSRPAPSS